MKLKLLCLLSLMLLAVGALGQTQQSTGSISANGVCLPFRTQNNSTVGIIVSGTWTGTLTPNVQIVTTSGAPTVAKKVLPVDGSAAQATITANGGFLANVAGFTQFNVCSTAWTSGTAVVTVYSTPAPNNSTIAGTSGSGLPAGCTGNAGVITCSGGFASGNLNGGYFGTEGTGASISFGAGIDAIYPDSTLHDFHVNANAVDLGEIATTKNTVTLTSKTLVNASIQRPKRWSWCTPGGSTTLACNGPDLVALNAGTGASVAAVGGEDNFISWTSGAVSGNAAGWASNAFTYFTGRHLYWAGYVQLANADLTNQISWFGLVQSETVATFNSNTVCAAASFACAMFRNSSTAPDTDWQCVTGTGAAQTVTDSGVAANVSPHVFEIQMNDGTNVVFSIDGAAVCTNTTNLPPTSTRMGNLGIITTQTTAAKVIQTAWLYLYGDK